MTEALDTWLSFNDLKRAKIVDNWPTLRAWINDPKIAFPPGRLLGPNSRRWNKQKEIDPWLASRPVEREEFDAPPRSRRRHTKNNAAGEVATA